MLISGGLCMYHYCLFCQELTLLLESFDCDDFKSAPACKQQWCCSRFPRGIIQMVIPETENWGAIKNISCLGPRSDEVATCTGKITGGNDSILQLLSPGMRLSGPLRSCLSMVVLRFSESKVQHLRKKTPLLNTQVLCWVWLDSGLLSWASTRTDGAQSHGLN